MITQEVFEKANNFKEAIGSILFVIVLFIVICGLAITYLQYKDLIKENKDNTSIDVKKYAFLKSGCTYILSTSMIVCIYGCIMFMGAVDMISSVIPIWVVSIMILAIYFVGKSSLVLRYWFLTSEDNAMEKSIVKARNHDIIKQICIIRE